LAPPVEQELPEQKITELSAHSTCTVQERKTGSGVPNVRAPQRPGAFNAKIRSSAPALASMARQGEARQTTLQTARTSREFDLMSVSFLKASVGWAQNLLL